MLLLPNYTTQIFSQKFADIWIVKGTNFTSSRSSNDGKCISLLDPLYLLLFRKLDIRYFSESLWAHKFVMASCHEGSRDEVQTARGNICCTDSVYANYAATWPLLYGNHNSAVTLNNPKILPQRLQYEPYSEPGVSSNFVSTPSHSSRVRKPRQ
jgi:hypothetical protein